MRKNKNQILRTAADEFTKKVSKLPSLLEIAIVGSMAMEAEKSLKNAVGIKF